MANPRAAATAGAEPRDHGRADVERARNRALAALTALALALALAACGGGSHHAESVGYRLGPRTATSRGLPDQAGVAREPGGPPAGPATLPLSTPKRGLPHRPAGKP